MFQELAEMYSHKAYVQKENLEKRVSLRFIELKKKKIGEGTTFKEYLKINDYVILIFEKKNLDENLIDKHYSFFFF